MSTEFHHVADPSLRQILESDGTSSAGLAFAIGKTREAVEWDVNARRAVV